MRQLRILKQGVWYEIRSQINNRQPLFRLGTGTRRLSPRALFDQVFQEAQLRFVFTVQALRLEDDWLSFYIKPEDGMELPVIMKWIKQTFAQRCNRLMGWIGHIWGDRYWSRILDGEPPEGASRGGDDAAPATGVKPPTTGVRPPTTRVRPPTTRVRPQGGKKAGKPDFPPIFPRPEASPPG